ncbi:MAG: hypothetical protein NVSMB66_6250 [Candidatus Doudnabacteria bacterium]
MSIFKTETFKNIDSEVFVGRFEGEDIEIQPGEVVTLAPHIVRHIAIQLSDKMLLRKADEYLATCTTDKQRSAEPSFRDGQAQAKLISQMRSISPEQFLREQDWAQKGMTPEMKAKLDAQQKKNMPVDSEQVNSLIESALAAAPSMKTSGEEFQGLSKLKNNK